ncbi:hypothetical protein EDC22_101205 [Tepidamorphus gemmatus]|uniref:Uncharacterized protein n=1 Tax=Tepidamorphus gemmatus TaxID=747076 RepID=A0A4R3MI83_9HYPH|nr:hypothetical protein [Tepidamorphus gemmatus]TCT13342.1 hypothetical protein EDC22_101205 [Tepidamorphus gemmatus]
MSNPLRDGVESLELTTQLTLGVLALASGVYTYLGVRDLLDGNAAIVFFAAIIYSAAVSVGIYAFWTFLMRFTPHVRDMKSRVMLFAAMLLGSGMIIAMSSWLNAAALAGSAALEQHLATTLKAYTRDLDRAHNAALATQSLLPDIQMASTRFARLAEAEREGSLTGTAGSGTVVQLLSQMSVQLDGLRQQVVESGENVKELYAEGGARLAKMRELVSGEGPVSRRSDAFATEATALLGIIAALQQTSVAASVKRAAQDLAAGFIAPVAGGRSADLAERQTAVVSRVEEAVAAQSRALAEAADEILTAPQIEPTQFQPLSTAEAVLLYGGDFIPSWAGAISIDLMPAVLVLILCVVYAVIRRDGVQLPDATTMTAAEMMAALRFVRELEREQAATMPLAPDTPSVASAAGVARDAPADAPAAESARVSGPGAAEGKAVADMSADAAVQSKSSEPNVTPLASARGIAKD